MIRGVDRFVSRRDASSSIGIAPAPRRTAPHQPNGHQRSGSNSSKLEERERLSKAALELRVPVPATRLSEQRGEGLLIGGSSDNNENANRVPVNNIRSGTCYGSSLAAQCPPHVSLTEIISSLLLLFEPPPALAPGPFTNFLLWNWRIADRNVKRISKFDDTDLEESTIGSVDGFLVKERR